MKHGNRIEPTVEKYDLQLLAVYFFLFTSAGDTFLQTIFFFSNARRYLWVVGFTL
jgi:hypothetical protein